MEWCEGMASLIRCLSREDVGIVDVAGASAAGDCRHALAPRACPDIASLRHGAAGCEGGASAGGSSGSLPPAPLSGGKRSCTRRSRSPSSASSTKTASPRATTFCKPTATCTPPSRCARSPRSSPSRAAPAAEARPAAALAARDPRRILHPRRAVSCMPHHWYRVVPSPENQQCAVLTGGWSAPATR